MANETSKPGRLEHWANWSQVIGAVAVVVSLVYVGLELDENTRVARNSTHGAILDMKMGWDSWLITDPGLAEIVARSRTAGDLSPAERMRFERYVTSGLNIWEYAYYGHRDGVLDPEEWGAWDRSFSAQILQRGWDEVWDMFRASYGEEFARHVDGGLERRAGTDR